MPTPGGSTILRRSGNERNRGGSEWRTRRRGLDPGDCCGTIVTIKAPARSSAWPSSAARRLLTDERIDLATGGNETGFHDQCFGTGIMQASVGEIRPDLFGAILLRSRSDLQAIRLCQRLRLIGLGSKPGQRHDRSSQDSEYGKGRERFDHVMLPTDGLNPAALGDQLLTINASISSDIARAWRQAALCRACVISDVDLDQADRLGTELQFGAMLQPRQRAMENALSNTQKDKLYGRKSDGDCCRDLGTG